MGSCPASSTPVSQELKPHENDRKQKKVRSSREHCFYRKHKIENLSNVQELLLQGG